MRADFAELRNSEGSLSAYSTRLNDAKLAVNRYSEAIKELRKQNEAFVSDERQGTLSDANRARWTRNINTIERYKIQISNLQHQMNADQQAAERLRTGVDALRKTTEAIQTSTKSYADTLRDQSKFYRAERTSIAGLRAERKSLESQLHAEISVTSSLRNSQQKLIASYKEEKANLTELQSKLASRSRELSLMKSKYGENSLAVQTTNKHIKELNNQISQSENKLNGFSERISKNSTTLANQAKQASKVASSYKEVARQSRGLSTTRLGSMFKAGSQHIQRFNTALKDSTANTRKWWSESKSAFAGVGVALGGVAAGAAKAVSDAAKVQRQYVEVRNLIRTSGESLSKSIQESNEMQRQGVKLSQEYGFSQYQIGEQYEELVRRGYSGTQALSAMNSMMKAARASGDDLADVVKVTSTAVDAFGLRSENTATMLAHTERVANALASGADRTASGFKDMGIGASYVASTAKTAGMSVEEMSGALGELSNRGIEGSVAGTGLRKVILSLIKPTKNAKSALKEAGLSISDFYDKSGNLKRIDTIFSMINEHTKGWGKDRQGAFFKDLFGTTGVAAGEALAQSADKSEKLDQNLTNLINHIRKDEKTDYIGRLAEKNMKSAQMQMKRLKRTAEAFELSVGAALLPAVNKVGKALAQWAVSKDGERSIKEFSKAAGNVATTIANHTKDIIAFGKGLGQGLKDGYHFIKPIVTGLGKIVGLFDRSKKGSQDTARNVGRIVGVFGTLAVGLKLSKALFGGIFAISKDTVGTASRFVTWIKGGTSAQKALNAQLAETNQLLKESVVLQKEQYGGKSSHHSSGGTGDALDTVSDAIDDVADLKGAKSEKIAKDAEETATKAAHFWQRGWLGKLNGFNKKLLGKLNPKNWTNAMAKAGDKAGKGFHLHILKHVKGLGSKAKSLFKRDTWVNAFGKLGDKAGNKFVRATETKLVNSRGKVKFSALFKYGSKAAEEAGSGAGMGFLRKFAMHIGNGRLKLHGVFSNILGGLTGTAEETGAKGATGFLGKFAGVLGKGANILGIGWSAAAAGIDIVKGIREHNPEKKQRDLGSGIGAVVGGGLSAAFLGPEAAPIGAAIGSAIGSALPKAIKWGQKIGGKVASGMQSAIKNIQKDGWNGVAKNWNDFWGGMGDWWDQTFDVNGKGEKHSSKRKSRKKPTISDRVIQTGVHVKKSDVANVKAMSSALKSYAGSLAKVKAELKHNDPSGELNKVNNFLKSHTSEWKKTAQPIKDIGDAFKYLAKFAGSVAKRDAFKAFNNDLPELDKQLHKHGDSIKKGINEITNALKGGKKGSTLISRFKSLDGQLKNTTSSFKNLNSHLNKTASDFKSIKKITDEFTGKKNPFKAMADGLDKLKSSLKKNAKDIKDYISTLKKAFESKKGKNFAEIIKDAAKPLGKMAGSFKSMKSSVSPISKGVKSIASNIKSLSKGGKKGGAITKVANEFDTLQKHLYKDRGSIKKSLSSINSTLTGKKGFVSHVNSANSSIKKLKSTFGSLASNTKSFASNLRTAASAIKTLSAKKHSLDSLSSSIKGLYKTVNAYKFGSKIASQAKTASKALSGKSSFASKFSSAAKSVKSTESSVANTFKSLKTSVVSSFKSMWSQVKSDTNDALDDIVSGINDSVDSINDSLDSMEGADEHHKAKHAHAKHLANGTGPITKTTLGILNDGSDAPEIQNREGLLHPNGMLEFLKGVNVPRLLFSGDQVIKSSDMSRLLGIRHFANGTVKNSIAAIDDRLLHNIYRVAQSLLKSVKSISSKVSKLGSSSKSTKLHDATYRSSSSGSSRSSSKKSSSKKTKSMVPFTPLGFYGNLKNVVQGIIKTGSNERVYLSQSTRRELGYKNAKGSTYAKATSGLIKRITSLYERRKRENEKIEAENKRKREESRKREQKKQELLKKKLDRENAKYNRNRKEAVLRAEERKARSRRHRSSSRLTERRTSTGGYTYTYTSTARRARTTSTRRRTSSARANVAVSVSGTKALDALLKKIKGNHKFKVAVSQSGAKSVRKTLSSILGKVNSSRSKRTMLIRIKQNGATGTIKYLNSVLKKVNSKRSKRTLKIHVTHDGVSETKKLLDEVIDKVKDLKKKDKNVLTIHVKHDGIHDTKKALDSVASTGKKMWTELESSAKKGVSALKHDFSSFSTSYKHGWSNLQSGIHKSFGHFWSNMRQAAGRGVNKVIDVLNAAIGQIDTVIRNFGGSKTAVAKARKVHYASGTGYFSNQRRAITKPTLAILNDGNDSPETQNKETIWDKSNNTFSVVQGRNVPMLLGPQHEVFNASESKALGFTHFATGTGALKQLYELAKKYWSHPVKTGQAMFNSIKGLNGAIDSLAQGMRDKGEKQGTEWWSQLWKMAEDKVNDGDLGPAAGLLKAVEELGQNKHYSQGKRMSKFFADCSSLVSRALSKYYHASWATPNGWALTVAGLWEHAHRIPRSEAKPGDPVFWLPDTHVGIYAGHDRYYSAYGPNDGGPVGMQAVAPGATFGRFNGLNTEGDKSKDVKVKANNALQKKIKAQVGKGFWKTIQKIADKYGENAGMVGAFKLGGDVSQRAKAIATALKKAVPGATREGLAGIIGSWVFESGGLNPSAINPDGGASGFGQWLGSRKTALMAYARRHGKSWTNPSLQLDFALHGDDAQDSATFMRILKSHGSAASAANAFSREWERGGYDAQHVSAAESIYKVLRGFANGGIATKASIFGEAGPEMAIPLSNNKLDRARELVAQTLAVMSDNSSDSSSKQAYNQQIMSNEALNQLVEMVNKLTEITSQLLTKPEMISTNISVDGQMLAQRLDKYQRQNQFGHLYNKKMNRSNF